jgi:hypothetical protein
MCLEVIWIEAARDPFKSGENSPYYDSAPFRASTTKDTKYHEGMSVSRLFRYKFFVVGGRE